MSGIFFFIPWLRRARTLKHQGEFVCSLNTEMIISDLQLEMKVADLRTEMDCH
jgi:hypothetical protein